ncbi:MAG: hypothetical protein ABSB15_26070 [Bryobacteraceae bacterium]
MKNFEEVDVPGPEEMKKVIAGLTPAEKDLLNDPNFITEDEADLILSDRSLRSSRRFTPVEDILKGSSPRRRRRIA